MNEQISSVVINEPLLITKEFTRSLFQLLNNKSRMPYVNSLGMNGADIIEAKIINANSANKGISKIPSIKLSNPFRHPPPFLFLELLV